MSEQQYYVIADRDKGDDPEWEDVLRGDRATSRSIRVGDFSMVGSELVRIERPVPTTDDPDEFGSDQLATAYIAWRNLGAGRDCERVPVAFEAGWDAHTASVPTSLPTREQIAAAQASILRQVAAEWAADPAAWGDNDRDYRNELRDRADALLHMGAER